jgi:hypothetical protein
VRVEAHATFTTLGEAQVRRLAGADVPDLGAPAVTE